MKIKTNVLVVDDDPFLGVALKDILAEDRYEVFDAANVSAGLQLAARVVPHLIVADMRMPMLSGLDLIAAVRANPGLRHIPILICSAQSPTNEDECLRLGANGYMSKPVDLGVLQRKVLDMLGHPA